MFKDDYRALFEQVKASDDLKQKTLQKINAKNAPKAKMNTYIRYGLVCASFLFVMAMFPVLYGNDGIAIEKDPALPYTAMPQTGVDQSIEHDIDNSLKQYYKTPEEIKKDLAKKQSELDALIKEKEKNEVASAQAVVSDTQVPTQAVKPPEHIDNKIQAYEKEIKEIEKKLDSEIKAFALPVTPNIIALNMIEQPIAAMKLQNYADDPAYKSEDWSQEQIVKYLESPPIPSYIPSDLTWGYPQEDKKADEIFTQKVYLNVEDGSFAYDTFSYTFAAPQTTKELDPLRRVLRVDVAKDKLPFSDCLYMKEDAAVSTIIGIDVKLGVCKIPYAFDADKKPISTYDLYVAEFINGNVGYRLVSSNLTQREFTDVVTSALVPAKKAS